jgi:aryl-alcohol dehydrogenase-like predicted oxidoreductase
LCQKFGLALLPWSPLAGGILAGRYLNQPGIPDGSRAARSGAMFTERITQKGNLVAAQLQSMAQERGLTSSQLALLWAKDQPGVTSPIIGPRTLAQLEDALGVLEKSLPETDRPLFDALVHPRQRSRLPQQQRLDESPLQTGTG